jgi:putative hydrolase of the HAD superfamily
MVAPFRRYLRQLGCPHDGVARALHSSCRDLCEGDLPSDWTRQVDAVPERKRALNLRYPEGIERALERIKQAGCDLWIITRGDLVRQAIKLACFPFINSFDVVEIVDRKNASTYAKVLADNGRAPSSLTMVGDAFWEDVAPVVRLGGYAVHVPVGPWAALRPLEQRLLRSSRIRVCRTIRQVPDALLRSRQPAHDSADAR